MFEKTLKTTYYYKGRMINMRDDDVKLENGKLSKREIVEHPGAVIIAAVTEDKKIVFIKQFRKPVEKVIFEIPAGLINRGESLESAAKRELQEETGYVAGKIHKSLDAYTTPGYSTEVIHYYLASDLKEGPQNFDEDEQVEVVLLSLEEAWQKILAGEIMDNKTIVGVMLAEKFLAETCE